MRGRCRCKLTACSPSQALRSEPDFSWPYQAFLETRRSATIHCPSAFNQTKSIHDAERVIPGWQRQAPRKTHRLNQSYRVLTARIHRTAPNPGCHPRLLANRSAKWLVEISEGSQGSEISKKPQARTQGVGVVSQRPFVLGRDQIEASLRASPLLHP
ncbi:hypothetical protein N658DRAFT_343234 [Parathielavia hyrcaniae]|uniref:Uncharacterized protein n=1 Tax=Parathielavia hyrcaniae TaxID=113614 RepID=A0AAN6T388_9PEZI|nr:hypothetical protein N658DRAFT_343234 [Parathielavia hyrcaniae]